MIWSRISSQSWWRPLQSAVSVCLPVLFLVLIGLLVLGAQSSSPFGTWDNFSTRQTLWLFLGLILMFIVAQINFRFWLRYSLFIYLVGLILCLLVAGFGTVINGQRSWFDFGVFLFQPVEVLKIGLILILARFYTTTAAANNTWLVLAFGAMLFFLSAGIIALQPDFGSTLILVSIWFLLTFTRGLNFKQWVAGIVVFLLGLTYLWFFGLKPYQKDRLLTLINPDTNSHSSGYNVRQALIAVGSGGVTGLGLGQGPQTQLKFLPVRQTDFIFAVIGEELGLIGTSIVIMLFVWLSMNILRLAKNARDDAPAYLALGIFALFFTQVIINIGMNIGLVPVTGLPLPFVSYGGTSLLVYFFALGLAANIAYQESYRSLKQVSKLASIDQVSF